MSEQTTADAQTHGSQRRDIANLHFSIRQAIKNTYTVPVIAGVVAVPFWNALAWYYSAIWLVTLTIAYYGRSYLMHTARDVAVIEANPLAWVQLFWVTTLGCAIIVASAPVLFFPALSENARMFDCTLLCCWLAAGMSSLGTRPRLYSAFSFIFVAGLVLGWVRAGGEFLSQILFALLAYAVVLFGFARNFAREINESLDIRFTNERLVAELTRSREAAEQANQAKSRFLAVASHDLRQPLHALTLLSGLLVMSDSAQNAREIGQKLGRSVDALAGLFNSLLDFSKIEAERVSPEIVWLSLGDLIGRLEHDYQAQVLAKGLSLKVQTLEVQVHTDAQWFERIVRNLLDNALKFTTHGGITIGVLPTAGGLCLAVSDTGPGIAPNLRQDIFKEYFQGMDEPGQTGLGLGLAIVRGLADLLALKVQVIDNQPHGARFEVEFSAAQVRSMPRKETGNDKVLAAAVDLQGYFVVYVDDDENARDAMRMVLDHWGCKSVIAPSLNEALTQLEGCDTPDAIISDYRLGGGRVGTEVIEALRQRYGPLAGALLSGESSLAHASGSDELEYPVLAKPMKATDLRELLEVFKTLSD